MSKSWNKVSIEANLISLPEVYWRLKEILDSHDYSLQDVAQLIVYDPGLTARLLKIVNSAYFGFTAEIATVNHAVSVVGVQQIESLVLTTSVADALGDYECEHLDVMQFWQRSVYRAIAARDLAGECNLKDSERMFVSGLLSGIGHLIMYQSVPVLAQQARRLADESGIALHLVEREIIGFNHADVAALLMRNWKLPESHVMVIKNHLEPDPSAEYFLETSVAHIAALLGNAFVDKRPLDEVLMSAAVRVWDATGLDLERCKVIDKAVGEQLSAVINLFFPKVRSIAV